MYGGKVIEVFGPYLVYEKLGVGGMAMVHRAKKRGIEGFEREVALKRLLPHVADDPDTVASFVREAKLVALLQHQSIAHVYELGRVDDRYFIAMEYVEGYSVLELLRCANATRQPLPIHVVLAILIELCDALEYAHTRVDDVTGAPLGIIHRDVSPSNLILTYSGMLKIIDFGVAKAGPDPLKTESGKIKGKFGYMSPEALRGEPLDARSDIFSAGVVAHELLTARRLFGSTYTFETLANIHRGEISAPSRGNPLVPAELDQVVLTALERDPSDRFPSAGAMRDALHRVALTCDFLASTDQTAAWLDDTFGGPELIYGPGPDSPDPGWYGDTEVDPVYPLSTPTFSGATPA